MAKAEPGKAVYSIFTSPHHAPQPDHLPTLMVTPAGRSSHILYIFMHTNYNQESYLLTPSDAGDLCVAKLFAPPPESQSSGSSSGHGSSSTKAVRCEASRNLRWSITNTGVAMPTYKLTLPNPDGAGDEQPLFQISKTNRMAPYWTMTYYTYAGHLIPPKRVEFGRIEKTSTEKGGDGGTRVIITGKTDEEKAVWKTLGDGNEDMVEWCVLCGALNVLDDEIREAAKAAGHPIRPPPNSHASSSSNRSDPRAHKHQLHPTGRSIDGALAGLRIVDAHRPSSSTPNNGVAPRSRPPEPKKTGSYDSRQHGPPPSPGPQGSYRSASPYRPPPQGGPPPSPGGPRSARPPQVPPNGFYQMPPPTSQPSYDDPRRPERSQAPPSMARSEREQRPSASRSGTAESRVDPRAFAPSPNGSHDSRRPPPNGYDSRPPPDLRSQSSRPDLRGQTSRPEMRSNGSHDARMDPRGGYVDPRRDPRAPSPAGRPLPAPALDSQASRSRAAPPASLRTGSAPPPSMSSSRLPPTPGSSGSSRPSPSSPPRGPPSSRTNPGRHERSSSNEAGGTRTMASTASNGRPGGREAIQGSYAPSGRRFGAGGGDASPTLAMDPAFVSSRGVQLQDVPASRGDGGAPAPSLKASAPPQPQEGDAAFSAAERIKQQRLARMRQASGSS